MLRSWGRRKNRFRFLLDGFDGVVPFRHDAVRSDAQLSHLGVGDLDAGLVGLPHEVGAHTQSGEGACGAQILQDGLVAVEGAARPVLADFAEQAVFDGVPLRRGGRVMGYGDAQAVAVAEAMLQVELPSARRGTVAAAAVGEDLQGLGLRIVLAALGTPPLLDAVDGERRGVGGSADEDGAGIGARVVDAVGDGEALGIGGEVVVVDEFGAAVPLRAGIAEGADELLLLRIDADNRDAVGGAALAQLGDVPELLVAVGMRGAGELLVVDAQRIAHRFELSRLLPLLRRAFPRARFLVRLDAGFATPEVFDFLDTCPRLDYVVSMPKNAVLVRHAEPAMTRARARSARSGRTEHVYGETHYAAGSWKRQRRVVIKAEVVRLAGREPRDNPRFVVTNLGRPPRSVYEKVYCARGDIENRIKELLDGLQIDRTSCCRFAANQFRVLLTAAAYVLMQELRLCAARTACARTQVTWLRDRLLKLGVHVVRSVRRVVLHLPRATPYLDAWRRIALALGARAG